MIPFPSSPGGWPVILADPPWSFSDKGSRIAPERAPGGRYETLSPVDIASMPIAELAARDAFLFLWTTTSHLLDGSARFVATAWGFEPKAEIVWVKCRPGCFDDRGAGLVPRVQIGMGHYVRNAHEHLLICRRGKAKVAQRNVPSVIFAPRGRHSAKPSESYAVIERLVGDRKKLELFARGLPRAGYVGWGDQFGLEAA